MSNPSFSNIDLWLFELAEGNLSPAQIEQLELFLLQHPELDVERDVWEMARVTPTAAVYPDQAQLERRRRPVGLYIGSATAILATSILIWSFFSTPIEGNGRHLSSVSNNGSKMRVFVKDGSTSGVAINASTPAAVQAFEIQNSVDLNVPAVNQLTSVEHPQLIEEKLTPITNAITIDYTNAGSPSGITHFESMVESSPQGEIGTETNTANDVAQEIPVSLMTCMTEMNEMSTIGAQTIESQQLVRELATYPATVVESVTATDYDIAEHPSTRNQNTYGISSTEYSVSFKSKLNHFGRKVQRMMDNPVALKNYRDPHYHLPGMLPNDINFSSTGTMLSTRVQSLSRLQWYGQENQQLTNQLSVDGYAYSMRGGVGLQVNHTLYGNGELNVASAALTYSPKISISRTISFEPSLRFKMGNKSLTKSKLTGIEQMEVERGNAHDFYPGDQTPIGSDMWYQDLGAGLMVNTEWFFAGVQLDNLFRHQDNIYSQDFINPRRADYHFIGSIGTDWVSRKENLGLSPYLVYQNNGKLSEAWFGANFRWNWLTVGAAISSQMDPAASIGVKFDRFALTYNADYVGSEMTGQQSLSHQLSLRFVSKPSRFGKRLLNL